MAFFFYKTPSFFHYIFKENFWVSTPSLVLFILLIRYLKYNYENEDIELEKEIANIKRNQKDMRMELISQMDPIVIETLRDIVRQDMKSEIEE